MRLLRLPNLPLRAIHASPLFLCFLSSSAVTLTNLPPVPARSLPDLVSLIHSISEKPGFRATLFRGLPAERRPPVSGVKALICGLWIPAESVWPRTSSANVSAEPRLNRLKYYFWSPQTSSVYILHLFTSENGLTPRRFRVLISALQLKGINNTSNLRYCPWY